MRHPIIGRFVCGYIAEGRRLALVENMIRERSTRQLILVVRLHGGPDVHSNDPVDRYRGARVRLPVQTAGLDVQPGEGEAWVPIQDYLEYVADIQARCDEWCREQRAGAGA